MGIYLRPESLDDALAAAAAGPVTVMAGCTDLFPQTEAAALGGTPGATFLDISRIADLRGIALTPAGLRIGAAVTWSELAGADLPPALDGLKAAARQVGSVQIQNAGTIGGNLCNASPAADGVPPLLTLDARVELASRAGTRQIALPDFLAGPRRTLRRPDEILTALHLPAGALAGQGAFLKLGTRAHLVISIVMVAVRLHMQGGRIAGASLAVGACGPVAARLPAQAAALAGLTPAEAAQAIRADLVAPALAPIDDIRADAGYRVHAATELLRRAVAGALA